MIDVAGVTPLNDYSQQGEVTETAAANKLARSTLILRRLEG